jgi:hypothetical protein
MSPSSLLFSRDLVMAVPRWFLITGGLILINLILVLASVTWRFARADEKRDLRTGALTAVARTAEEPGGERVPSSAKAPSSGEDEEAAWTNAANGQPTEPAGPNNPLDSLSAPTDLPEVPSLADPEMLENDPVFRELRQLFSEREDAYPPNPFPRTAPPADQTKAYIEALDGRLRTVERLCVSARGIAADAAALSAQGKPQAGDELMEMAIQLRDMAAKLLVSEL